MFLRVACYIVNFRNMCVYIHVEIEVVVFHMLFPILLLQQVSALLTSAHKQISLQPPVIYRHVTMFSRVACYIMNFEICVFISM